MLYLPLLNLQPSDGSTMLTRMLKAVDLSKAAGHEYVVLTLDQQLYRVALHILWDDSNQFPNFFLRLGGMHLLISFVCASSTPLNGSGEIEVLGPVFAGVTKMLSGKKFPYNVRALRILVEDVLRPILCYEKQDITCMADLQTILDQLFSHASAITTHVFMESPKKERTVIDIDATVKDNLSIIPGLLATHALTGCDTVATCYGIGKGTALKVLHAGWYLLKYSLCRHPFNLYMVLQLI